MLAPMRASRLVNVLLLLQTRGLMTAGQLAAELEVSERTIHRDVQALAEAGVPVFAERGPAGGIRLVDGYRTRLTGLTTDEAEALFLSGLPGPAAELGLGTVVAAARLKVLAALPPELRSRASRINQRFLLDAPGWFQAPDAVPHLETLAAAVWDERRLRIDYRRGDRIVTRELDPLGLVLKGGVWYLVARAEGQDRTYRVSRVEAAVTLDEPSIRPPDFDLAAHWAESIAAYEQENRGYPVRFRVAPDGIDRLMEALGDLPAEVALRANHRDDDGWLRVQHTFDWRDQAIAAAITLGSRAEIVAPDDLRALVVARAEEVLRRHAAATPAPEVAGVA